MTDDLVAFLAETSSDPVAHVLGAFPWGESGTELAHHEGPEAWQLEILSLLRDGLIDTAGAIRLAVTSGHGVGKSALVAWIILWGIGTLEDTRGVITANTENQLKTKTWAELAKWFRLWIAKPLFEFTATGIFSRDPEHEKTWRIDMVPWSERNTEAFAGLHNQGKRIILIFDEGSAIPDVIYQTAEGALTDKDTQIIWCVFGNPTKLNGRFHDIFTDLAHRWKTRKVDSRTVRFTDKAQIAEWIDDYGLDSDFVRVRILGEFPKSGTVQFIETWLVETAQAAADPAWAKFEPLIIGVDVARFGDDASRITFRRGRDARSIPSIELRQYDTMALAARVAEVALAHRANAVFVDGGGVGGGVVDRLRQLNIPGVIEVQFGSKADRLGSAIGSAHNFANKRAEMWGCMKAWLATGAIENDKGLKAELTAPEYHFRGDSILLEKKEDMRKRGVPSPDWADSLALTFAYPVAPVFIPGESQDQAPAFAKHEYDPLEIAA